MIAMPRSRHGKDRIGQGRKEMERNGMEGRVKALLGNLLATNLRLGGFHI